MRNLVLMFHVVASFACFSLARRMLGGFIKAGQHVGLDVDAAVLVLRSRLSYWHYRHELDGVYSLHLEQARDGALELYWRHHSAEETPAEVFSSLWQAAASAASQIQHYLSFVSPREWAPTTNPSSAWVVSDVLPF